MVYFYNKYRCGVRWEFRVISLAVQYKERGLADMESVAPWNGLEDEVRPVAPRV
jgi:hypothetical protein